MYGEISPEIRLLSSFQDLSVDDMKNQVGETNFMIMLSYGSCASSYKKNKGMRIIAILDLERQAIGDLGSYLRMGHKFRNHKLYAKLCQKN